MTETPAHVLIVGGGIAGVSTAVALRAGGFDGEITVVDAGEFPYDRPPLSKDYLAGSKTLRDIALQPEGWYDDHAVRLVNNRTVASLRPREGSVELSGGEVLPADRIVLATGGRAARPPIPGADGPRVHVLRTAEDADGLRSALVPGARLLVVGAGLIGAEAASTALRLRCEVTLVDPVPTPLVAAVGEDVAGWLHRMHTDRGVTTLTAGVSALTDDGGEIRATVAGEEEARSFDVALLGVGMVPDIDLAVAAGLETDRGVVVDRGQTTSNPGVLAVGDSCRTRVDGVLLPPAEHWEAAQQDGQRAAATILGAPPPAPTAPWFWSDRHGHHPEAAGHMSDADTVVLRGNLGDSTVAAFGLRDGRVVAVVAVDQPTTVKAGRRMIDRGAAPAADQLADPGVDLRKLLRG